MAGDDETMPETDVNILQLTIASLETELSSTKNDLSACRTEVENGIKTIEKTKRQLEKANSYNEELQEQMKDLSQEVQVFRDRCKNVQEIGVQAIAENILSEMGNKPLPQWESTEEETVIPETTPVLSIAESLKQAAEEHLAQSGFVFDDNSGLYYDSNTGYYYNCEEGLYYDPNTGTYFFYNDTTGEYEFHSQVEPQPLAPTTDQTAVSNSTKTPSDSKDKRDKKKGKRRPNREEPTRCPVQTELDEVTDALHNLGIQHRRQNALEISSNWPPCIRVMVTESDCLDEGDLFIITCDGATIGRETEMIHSITIPDLNVSKIHAQVQFDYNLHSYTIVDIGSQNGTFINDVRISEAKSKSDSQVLNHGDILRLGNTTLQLHVHPGTDTCDDCEPGQVIGRLQALEKANREIVITTKADRLKEQRNQLKQIKKKYGLKNCAYEDDSAAFNKSGYEDKAEIRRRKVGSDNPHVSDEAPASVTKPISTENKGRKLLAKMGWKEGQGLGKDNAGIAEPIHVTLRTNRAAGLGSGVAMATTLDHVESEKRNQRWLHAQQRYKKLEEKPVDLSQPTNISFSFKKAPAPLQHVVDLGGGDAEEVGEEVDSSGGE